MVEGLEFERLVLVCQNRSCRKQGAEAVLAAFLASPVANVKVIGSSCLGKCGNGPMVLVMPEQVWYGKVHPGEVTAVIKQHLEGGHPVVSMFY